jgi:hypothetical protein
MGTVINLSNIIRTILLDYMQNDLSATSIGSVTKIYSEFVYYYLQCYNLRPIQENCNNLSSHPTTAYSSLPQNIFQKQSMWQI